MTAFFAAHWLEIAAATAGLLLGSLLAWLWFAAKTAALTERLKSQERRAIETEARLAQATAQAADHEREAQSYRVQLGEASARLEAESKAAAEKQQLLERAEQKLADTFKALSSDALKDASAQFLHLAKAALGAHTEEARGDIEHRRAAIEHFVKPMTDALGQFQQRLGEIEHQRTDAYAELRAQVRALGEGQSGLRRETAALVTALRQPSGRGQWGEIQLQRVVELAGMREFSDFASQPTATGEGRDLRPDMIVRLPGGKTIVVDSKAPMDAYLDAIEATDETAREEALGRHARQVRAHIQQLSSKNYTSRFADTPEFTVMFLPGESFFSAALQSDPALIEWGVNRGVILATPTTLIALLRTVAHAWRQESLAANAREISTLGATLHERLSGLARHFATLGRSLGSTVDHYNQTVGAFETRVLSAARRFTELQAATPSAKLPEVHPLNRQPRSLHQPDALPTDALPTDEDFAFVPTMPHHARDAAADLRAALDAPAPTYDETPVPS